MQPLTALYDSGGPLCRWATRWLSAQDQLIDLRFVPAASPAARSLYLGLVHGIKLESLRVVADVGGVSRGDKAWLMVLWCLVRNRSLVERLSDPLLMPMSSRFEKSVSKYRPCDDEPE